ncbi:MAG: nuclear transport factor 2 family protein [Deltaproteobacteria bacterium]|nr:nuclear transport factor 2 family protein [Deltaproteobacteria bacterium]
MRPVIGAEDEENMRVLSREEIAQALKEWNQAWSNHDLAGVMDLFHDEILFENWTGGKAQGKETLRKAWSGWFEDHGGFRFMEEETFIDETQQKALYRWQYDGPSLEKGCEGRQERRRGVDVLHFKDGKIIRKLTYSKTTLLIDGEKARLSLQPPEP